MATYTFGSIVGASAEGGVDSMTSDASITAVEDNGSILPGDAVSLSVFVTNDEEMVGQGYYLGTGTFGGVTGYVIGQEPTASESSAFFVVFDGEEGGSQAVEDAVWDYAMDPSIQELGTDPACFAAGSLIAVPHGEVTVETLAIGDIILTADGREVPVKWIGYQTLHKFFTGDRYRSVRVKAGALGNGLPHSDLTLTADHALMMDGLAINVGALVNGDTIIFVPMSEVPDQSTYYHIETENHDAILANGAAAETFIDYIGRKAFDNYREYLDLYGAERIIPEMHRPRISTQRLVPQAIRDRLNITEENFNLSERLIA